MISNLKPKKWLEKKLQNKWESEEITATITSDKPEFMRIKVKQVKVDNFS